MRWLILLALLAACARKPPPRDSPAFLACKHACLREGKERATVLEDEDALQCYCKGAQWHEGRFKDGPL